MLACLLVSEKENPFIYLPETKALIYISTMPRLNWKHNFLSVSYIISKDDDDKMAKNQKVVCGKTLKLGLRALSIVHISNENIFSFPNKMKEKSAFNLSFFLSWKCEPQDIQKGERERERVGDILHKKVNFLAK